MRVGAPCPIWRSRRSARACWTTTSALSFLQRCTSTNAGSSSSTSASFFESSALREARYSFWPGAVITNQSVVWAQTTVRSLDQQRDKRFCFFDEDTSKCVLCGIQLTGGYRTHQQVGDHVARLAIVERTLALLHTFHSQVATTDSMPSATLVARRTRNAAAAAVDARAVQMAARQSCYHTNYSESFLFDEDGVPPRELLHHRPQMLQQLDLVDVLLKRWWRTLHHSPAEKGDLAYHRILSLSSDNLHSRLYRLRYLLFFLASRGVLRDSVPLTATRSESGDTPGVVNNLHRNESFERYEAIGDFEFKFLVADRLPALFPTDEGGVVSTMHEMSRVLDSNHGLLAIYDYLNLDALLSVSLANNKTKADIVEALLGELRALLWTTEVAYTTDTYTVPGDRATTVYLRALVEHTLYEFGHVVLMWRIDAALRGAKDVITACLAREFDGGKRRRHGENPTASSEADLNAKAPRNALQPLLLPWERRHGAAHSAKDEADYAVTRRPARPLHTFQEGLTRLALSPMTPSLEEERQFSVGCSWSATAAVVAGMMDDVAASLPLEVPALMETTVEHDGKGCGSDGVAVSPSTSSSPRHGSAATSAIPDLQSKPRPRASHPPPPANMRELLRANCVVLRGPVPSS